MRALLLLLAIVAAFYWKLTFSKDYTWLDSPDLVFMKHRFGSDRLYRHKKAQMKSVSVLALLLSISAAPVCAQPRIEPLYGMDLDSVQERTRREPETPTGPNLDLTKATLAGNVRAAEAALQRGAKVNYAFNLWGTVWLKTQLMYAAEKNNLALVKLLLRHGATVNPPVRMGGSPLFSAIFNGNLEMTTLLLDAGADVHKAGHSDMFVNRTPLYWAVDAGSLPIVRLLVARGADPSQRILDDAMISTKVPVEIREYLGTLRAARESAR